MADGRSDDALTTDPVARFDPVARLDEEGRVVDWNDRCRSLFRVADPAGEPVWTALGLAPDGPLGASFAEGPPEAKRTVEVTLEAGGCHEVALYPDGDACLARFEERPEPSRETLERYLAVLQHLPEAVYLIDEHGEVEFVNEMFAEMYGTDPEHIANTTTAGAAMRSEDMERCRDLIRRQLSEGAETGDWEPIDILGITVEGEYVRVENRQAVYVEDGEFQGTFGTMRDVSDSYQMSQRLEVLERVLRHNLRTQVSLIDAHVDSIADRYDDPETTALVGEIRSAIDRLLVISDKTRRVGQAIVSPSDDDPIDFRATIDPAVERVSADHPDASIRVDVDPDLSVQAGPALQLAIQEILENAVVHNDGDASIEVVTETVDVDAHDVWEDRRHPVAIRIADDGPGIPETERAVVAEDEPVSPLRHSDGLGLWSAAWIVEAYGGTVEIEDRDPTGSVVEVVLPIAE